MSGTKTIFKKELRPKTGVSERISTVKKRAVWIFDDAYKVATLLSVASFQSHVKIPITLFYCGKHDPELISAFENLGPNIEMIVKKQVLNAVHEKSAGCVNNRLLRMQAMREWPQEQVILFDSDTIFSPEISTLIELLDRGFETVDQSESLIWGATEYDLKFFTEKQSENGCFTHVSEGDLHQCIADVYGNDWNNWQQGLQYNNGVLIMYNACKVADRWELNYLKGLNHPMVNPADDQLPLREAMFTLQTQVNDIGTFFNSQGKRTGDYCTYHTFGRRWVYDIIKISKGAERLSDYGKIAKQLFHLIPPKWLMSII